MKVGFTGTQHGMTTPQLNTLRRMLEMFKPTAFHHGSCVGADDEAHAIATMLKIEIEKHPAHDVPARKQADCRGGRVHSATKALIRNKHIVQLTDVLIACPKEYREVLRSGTWSTVRHAARLRRCCYLITPDGKVEVKDPGGAERWFCGFCCAKNEPHEDVCPRCDTDRPTKGART